MKRSEVLQAIYVLLHSGADLPTEEEILSKIEEMGMLPPESSGFGGCDDPLCCSGSSNSWDYE